MRKITREAVGAFLANRTFASSNTHVSREVSDGAAVVVLCLHGNAIAKRVAGADGVRLYVRTAGWPTTTTKERLNGLPGVSVYHHRHVLHLNGKPWDNDSEWTEVTDG